MNRLLRIRNSRFLRRVSARTVVLQHSTNKQRRIALVVKFMYKKTYLSFRVISSRPLRQIKQGTKHTRN